MQFLKRVKKFVAGSEKFFDIYSCKVDEVEEYLSDTGKQMIRVKINSEEYVGLYNKWVYEFLCSNEGSDSFVVLWNAPKGKKMVAYVKEIWQDHLEGKDMEDVSTDINPNQQSGEAFVYCWINKDDDRKYIGTHKGNPNDGYIASSESFLNDYNECPTRFVRTILAYGTQQKMYELETKLLLDLKTRMSPMYYNLSNNLRVE